MVERLGPTESGVVALHREVSGFQRDDAERFAFFVAQFSRFRDATCRLDSRGEKLRFQIEVARAVLAALAVEHRDNEVHFLRSAGH